jgi:peptidase M28-like protein
MSKVRRVALAAGLVLAVAAAVAIPSSAAPTRGKARSSNDHPHGPSPALRSMLREIDARRVERDIRTLAGFGTRHTLSSQTDPNRGIGAARDWIYDQLTGYAAASDGRMTVQKQSFVQPAGPRNPVPVTVTNLVATLRGTQPESADRVYVVSGHYDSRCTDVLNATCDAPGADDDASGVAAVLELARVMAKRQFDATIVFMAVAGEEQNLFGSTFFAQQAKAAGMDVEGMFTNDIIGSSTSDKGRRDPFTVRLFSEGVPTSETPQQAALRQSIGGENDGPSRQLARYVKEVGENSATGMHVRLVWRRDRFLRGGDQIPFLQQGYPAARFTEPAEDFAHQHQDVRVENGKQFGDLPEFVDFAYTARVARVNGAALANLAWAPTAPKNARIDTTQLTNDTTVTWNANPEPDLAGYEVVWRESTAPLWEHTIPVGNVTRFTIPDLSKDNVQVGVRAVDRDGYRSPVAFPIPSG